ncbi:MAG: TonB-dependent starch-binding outer membrane protein SusC [Tenuifilum sp.]|uniref:SusC/RagA family TonB-linked outer membrane protein n=1 Tax=Tenuifilum sp. TaxID=2760880 RepID=UPI0024AADCBD|nr:TonB-dependent receptor [Tenuifilum sp.]MDI3527547.1 TonB-dependent starch-binding outer membrane protein SusC [Tenuifilum sp.]
MKNKRSLLSVFVLLALMLYQGLAFGQSITVTGTVTDAATKESLPGVSVFIKGTTIGTVTDASGHYSIQSQSTSDVLVFSYVGYQTFETSINGRTMIDVEMVVASEQIGEVVVIGYGTVKKTDLTASVSSVSSKDFNKGAITSPQELLVGKAAGVVITTGSGAPGSGATIRIRGGSSLNASNDPLVIVDGIPLDNNNVSGSSNLLSFINPNDIESVTVLKDAASASIYGSRASNGVILITTKKARAGAPLKVSYNVNTSISTPIKFIDVYSGDELRQIAYEKRNLYGADKLLLLGSENTNWQGELFRTAMTQDHNLSFSGSTKYLPYQASIGYTNQTGIMKNTDMQRVTGALNLNPSFFKNTLNVTVNAKGMSTKHNFGDEGALGSAINMDPTQPIYDGNTNSAGYFQWENYGANLGTPNPVEQLMVADNKSDVTRFIGNLQLNYKLPFVEGLQANLNMATDYSKGEGHNNRPYTSPNTLRGEYFGRLSNYSSTNKNNLLDFYLNYNRELNFWDSKIDATAGYSWQHYEREGDSFTRSDSVNVSWPYKEVITSYITENYLVSFFGRVNYSMFNKYLITATVRYDGSSRFAEGNRWGFFPSAAFAWKVKEEDFLKNVNVVSDLKFRMSWGVTGQQDIFNDYPAQARYIASSEGSYYPIDGEFRPTLRPNAYDPDIKWEETTTQNVGIDFGLFNNRIYGSFDLYKRETKDLLNVVNIPSGSNFSNVLLTNVGSLENKGFEVELNLVPISTKDMNLTLGFNLTYNKNKITKLLLSDDPNFIGILYGDAFTGQKQVTRVGYPAYSFFVNKQIYDVNGNPIEGLYEDLSGEGGIVNGDNADKYIYHNPNPDYLMGLSIRFSYKNFDLSTSSRASIGNYVYNGLAAGASYDQMYQIGYWKNFTTQLNDTRFVKRQFTSDYFVENASFLKVDHITAGYNFNNILNKINLRVSFTVQNAITVTKYKGIDPEVNGGVDYSFYPRPRTYLLGLGFTF